MPKSLGVLAVVAVAITLSSCGTRDHPQDRAGTAPTTGTNSGSSDSGSFNSSATYPHCADVWKIGKRLPSGYEGTCSTATATVNDGGYTCADGSHVWLYDDGSRHLYALPNEAIKTMSTSDWVAYLIGTCKPK